jgi:hypothetical protein
MPYTDTVSYYVLDSASENMMLLEEPVNPGDEDSWFGGCRFQEPPDEPVVVEILPDNENGDLLPYFGTATLMNAAFCEALREAGVDNIDFYDAVIRSSDGLMTHTGYKAFNIVGVVQAADLERTVFNDPPGTRLIDASIDTLAIRPDLPSNLLIFRLAEYLGAVIVHEQVKRVIEARNFPYIIFRDPGEFIS